MDLAIIADDLTGAILVGAFLEGLGVACPVVLGSPEAAVSLRTDMVVFATRTRLATASEAVQTVTTILDTVERSGASPQIAYKACSTFDSTDEGNIGPVADLLLARYGDGPLLMSAGYPKFGTTVHQGYLFYRGRLVSESIKRHDPLTPMSDPDLVRTIQRQTQAPVGLVPHGVLIKGAAAASGFIDQLQADGISLVLLDCSDDQDARVGAELTLHRRATLGSDAHVMALAEAWGARSETTVTAIALPAGGPGVALFGSLGPVADAQFSCFERHHSAHRINLLEAATLDAIVAKALAWAEPRIGDRPFGLTTAPKSTADVLRAQEAFGNLGAARRAEQILAGVAAGLVKRGVSHLAVSGGEVSGAVAKALQILTVRCLPDQGFGGLCVADQPRPLTLFFKSGKLGKDDVMVQALASMNSKA